MQANISKTLLTQYKNIGLKTQIKVYKNVACVNDSLNFEKKVSFNNLKTPNMLWIRVKDGVEMLRETGRLDCISFVRNARKTTVF